MNRVSFAALVLVFLAVSLTPSAAAVARLEVRDINLLSEDGTPLEFIPQEGLVRVAARIANAGSTNVTNGTVTVRFVFRGIDTSYSHTANFTRTVTLRPNQTTDVEYLWSPAGRVLGNQSVAVTILAATGADHSLQTYSATFTVTKTAVEQQEYWERLLRYTWFFGAFLATALLGFVALGVRRS